MRLIRTLHDVLRLPARRGIDTRLVSEVSSSWLDDDALRPEFTC
jgi:hypothetical protein